MNREELDAWFAKADDVLTDWHGGTDAMRAEPSKGDVGDLPLADSYYEQPLPRITITVIDDEQLARIARQMVDAMRPLVEAFAKVAKALAKFCREHPELLPPAAGVDLRDQALEARRNRNTGPADRRGIDGHLRRRTR